MPAERFNIIYNNETAQPCGSPTALLWSWPTTV